VLTIVDGLGHAVVSMIVAIMLQGPYAAGLASGAFKWKIVSTSSIPSGRIAERRLILLLLAPRSSSCCSERVGRRSCRGGGS
jgi:hypothetical protein